MSALPSKRRHERTSEKAALDHRPPRSFTGRAVAWLRRPCRMAEQCEVDGQQPFEVKRRSLADRRAVLGEPGIGGHAAEAEQVIDEGPAVVHFARGAERREDVTGVDAVEMNARDTRGVDQPL